MIKTGIDIIDIKRIENACKNDRFLDKILTLTEFKYVEKKTGMVDGEKKLPYATIAGLFAAKEAASKALGTGLLVGGVGFLDIEIDHTKFGAPILNFYGKAAKLCGDKPQCSVSISHDAGIATAIVCILS